MKKRRQLATGALNKMEDILRRHKTVNKNKRLKLYKALVKSVLTYNSCTWGMSTKDGKEMKLSQEATSQSSWREVSDKNEK